MSNSDPTPANEDLRVNVISTGTAAKLDTIAPEDQHYADKVLEMDPFSIPNSNISGHEGLKPLAVRVTGLPPGQQRSDIEAQLQGLTPEQRSTKEPELVGAALRKMLPEIRMMTGAGEDALPYHREQALIAREYWDLARQRDRLTEDLERVRGYNTDFDPKTGEAVAVPIPFHEGDSRNARQMQLQDIERQMRVLLNEDGSYGVEGKRRMTEQLRETVGLLKQRDQQVAEGAEVARRAEEINRNERIEAQAQALARMNRNSVR